MIYSIFADQADKFTSLAPEYILNQLKLKDNYAFATVEDEEAKGLIVFYHSEKEKTILVKWLFVAVEFREYCIADQLLSELFNTAQKLGAVKIKVQIPHGDENAPIYRFFVLNDFYETGREGREYFIPLSEVRNNSMLYSVLEKGNIESLDFVSLKEYRHFLIAGNLSENMTFGLQYPFYGNPQDEEMFARRNSFAATDAKGNVSGLYIMEHLSDNYYAPVLFAENSGKPAEAISLIKTTFENLYHRQSDSVIIMRVFSDRSLKLAELIFPESGFMPLTEMECYL